MKLQCWTEWKETQVDSHRERLGRSMRNLIKPQSKPPGKLDLYLTLKRYNLKQTIQENSTKYHYSGKKPVLVY